MGVVSFLSRLPRETSRWNTGSWESPWGTVTVTVSSRLGLLAGEALQGSAPVVEAAAAIAAGLDVRRGEGALGQQAAILPGDSHLQRFRGGVPQQDELRLAAAALGVGQLPQPQAPAGNSPGCSASWDI